MITLGLTGGFHFGSCDAAAAVIRDGVTLAAVEEERLTRTKNSFGIPPARCIRSALEVAGLDIRDVDVVGIYVESYPDAVREMQEHIETLFGYCPPIKPVHHHLCHAASTYYASGWKNATVITFDWSGDGVSSSIWHGRDGELRKVEFIARPNSLGIYYAAFTQFLGFERGDEYKVMGLAGYSKPTYDLDAVLDVSGEVYVLNLDIVNPRNRSMHQLVTTTVLDEIYPGVRRARYQKLDKKHMDMAASVQLQFERAVFNFTRRGVRMTGSRDVCIAGGGGLNCTANGKLVKQGIADRVYLPPFPNDTGCAFGAAAVLQAETGIPIKPLTTSQLGPSWDDDQIKADLDLLRCPARYEPNVHEVVANAVASGELVGWFQGGMEIGPRALGGRSILADPRDKTVKDRINKYVKFREDFRPFAPSVLSDAVTRYFDYDQPSPFMSFIAPVKVPEELPGVTHVDGTARLQTVDEPHSPYGRLLGAMEATTGYPVVVNTSFNYMGQPIVCTPKEAIYTFYGTGLTRLALGRWVIAK